MTGAGFLETRQPTQRPMIKIIARPNSGAFCVPVPDVRDGVRDNVCKGILLRVLKWPILPVSLARSTLWLCYRRRNSFTRFFPRLPNHFDVAHNHQDIASNKRGLTLRVVFGFAVGFAEGKRK